MRPRSRLLSRFERQTKKKLLLSFLAIIVLFLFLLKFGIPILVNLSVLLGTRKQETNTYSKSITFVPPPILDPLPDSTNSAQIDISGIGMPNKTVILYINNKLIGDTKTDRKGKFLFKQLTLDSKNLIKARTKINGKESDYSQTLTITFKNTPPLLTMDSPQHGQTFSKDQNTVEVKGKTDPDARVTVNSYWSVVSKDNTFSYTLPLVNGENTIKVVATDNAGNKTEKEIKVTYNP